MAINDANWMSQTDMLLNAAVAIHGGGAEVFSPEELAVNVWRRHPETFSLKGFPDHPDSNKVLVALMCKTGPLQRGLLVRVASRRYSLCGKILQELRLKGPAGIPWFRAPDGRMKAGATVRVLPEPVPATIPPPPQPEVPVVVVETGRSMIQKLKSALVRVLDPSVPRDRLRSDDLAAVFRVVSDDAVDRPTEAAEELKDALNEDEIVFGDDPEFRAGRNACEWLVDRFLGRLVANAETRQRVARSRNGKAKKGKK